MDIVHGPTGERVHTYLERLAPFGFAGAALAAVGGEVLLNHGYGYADREKRIRNRADTIFNLGSITKQFTAAAILRLEMQGGLSTGDSLGRYFAHAPQEKRAITLHHLLTHTAGTALATGEDYEHAGRDETVQKILDTPLLFEPGSAYYYSNAGYTLLAALIEQISGQSYEAFLAEAFFRPAGMRDTGYRLPHWDPDRLARGYIAGEDRGIPIEKIYPSWNVMGNGEMLSTTGDLYRWYLALKNRQALSDAALQKLWTPYLQNYAYGWVVHETEYGMAREHSGAGDTGMGADWKWYADQDTLIVLFNNQDLPNRRLPISELDGKISALVFGDEIILPPPLFQEASELPAEDITGAYTLTNGASFSVLRQPDGLVLYPENQEAIQLIWGGGQETERLNQRTARLFGSLVDGDPGPLAAELDNPGRLKRFVDFLEEAVLKFGPDRTWKIIGTAAAGEGEPLITLMPITAGEEHVTLRVYWKQDQLYGLGLMEGGKPLGIALSPAADGLYMGYDIAASQAIEVSLLPQGLEVERIENPL